MMEPTPNIPPSSTASSTATSAIPAQSTSSTAGLSTVASTTSSSIVPDAPTLLATQGVVEEEDLAPDPNLQNWLADRGLLPEDFESEYGLLAPEDTVIIRPYGGEDDDILLQELRPRFVIMYEPNLAFIRRLEVSPGKMGFRAQCLYNSVRSWLAGEAFRQVGVVGADPTLGRQM